MRKFSVNFWSMILKMNFLNALSIFWIFLLVMFILCFWIPKDIVIGVVLSVMLFLYITAEIYLSEKDDKRKD